MNKKELFDVFDGFSENLIGTLSELEGLKKEVQQILEDNARLRIENSDLRSLLNRYKTESTDKSSHPSLRLASIYDEGFHVCNDLYGERRDGGDCMFCDSLLNREN